MFCYMTIVFILTSGYFQSILAKDYCAMCSDHTMCQYGPECPLSRSCSGIEQKELTAKQQQLIIQTHNDLRQKVVNGEVKGQPAAERLDPLKWNEELATIAQCWANQCILQHDKCRDISSGYVGQNIGWYSSSARNFPVEPVIKDSLIGMFEEYKVMPPDCVKSYSGGGGYGHYSQIVWAGTKMVGCGLSQGYTQDKMTEVYLICNYFPGGNVVGEPIYKTNSKNGVGKLRSDQINVAALGLIFFSII